MPARWQIAAPAVDATRVRVEHLHAVVSGWFDVDDAAHQAKMKPYTVSPPADGGGGTVFEVATLADELTDRLLTAAAPGQRLRFGSQVARLAAEPQQVAAAPWTQLAQPTGADAWCLRFVTPTTFRRGNCFTPWMAPKPVLGGLRAAWRAFAPPGLADLVLDLADDPVWVSDVDGANEVLKVSGLTVSGFVGRVRYVCAASASVCAAVDRLMRLAVYAGVGAYTTKGLGLVRLEPTWRQRW